jgi:hypothetical protein
MSTPPPPRTFTAEPAFPGTCTRCGYRREQHMGANLACPGPRTRAQREAARAEREAARALDRGLPREYLAPDARDAFDRLAEERAEERRLNPPPPAGRSAPETRARILEMFRATNRKYALPFERDRLAAASFFGGNWEEYGSVVLQMAILDTLLSIEELLSAGREAPGTDTAAGQIP